MTGRKDCPEPGKAMTETSGLNDLRTDWPQADCCACLEGCTNDAEPGSGMCRNCLSEDCQGQEARNGGLEPSFPACRCPHGWSTIHMDLTAAGNRSPSHRAWTRSDTDPACPEHGTGRKAR